MSVVLTRRCFTVDEYHRMGEAGILHEDERIELIEGEILQMAAIGGRHIATVNRFADELWDCLAHRAIVSVQNPVRLAARLEPQPDVAVLRYRDDFYDDAPPEAIAVLLLIEVADTSLAYDRDVKLPLYTAAGIPEVWIADLEHRVILVYRDPEGSAYRQMATLERGATLTPLTFPDVSISVSEILR